MLNWVNNMVVLNDRELLVDFNERHVLRCDIDNKFLGVVCMANGRRYMELTRYRLQESIAPLPSRGMQGDVDPTYSAGHD